MVIGIHNVCWKKTILNNERCNFPAINVLEESLRCQQSNKVVYQGRIIGTRHANPAVILDYINNWIMFPNDDSTTFSIEDDENIYTLRVDKTCPPYLASPSDSNCIPELTYTMADVLPLMASGVMIIVMVILTVAHFINMLKQNKTNFVSHTCNYHYKLNKC